VAKSKERFVSTLKNTQQSAWWIRSVRPADVRSYCPLSLVLLAGIPVGVPARIPSLSDCSIPLLLLFDPATCGLSIIDGRCLDLPSLSVRDALALLRVAFLVRSLGP